MPRRDPGIADLTEASGRRPGPGKLRHCGLVAPLYYPDAEEQEQPAPRGTPPSPPNPPGAEQRLKRERTTYKRNNKEVSRNLTKNKRYYA